jgi:osmoprotectant transport system ATP-binding protein
MHAFYGEEPYAVITFEGVTKRYGDGTVALDNLTLECPTGKLTVFVGTSGGGKTTALRMINRMITPTSGRVLIDGVDVASKKAAQLRREIGYVIQQAGLFPHRTIVDNVATVPVLLGVKKKAAREAAVQLMERVGLPASFARRYPYQLSGGQQQRVGVARALAADPPVLLMDEPFSAVDPVVRADLQRELLRLQGDIGKTIVFVTHDIDEAILIGDMIAVFRTGGQLVQFDAPQTLLARPADAFVESFVGHDRGIRGLSFHPASTLTLSEGPAIAATATAGEAKAAAADEPWILVLDADRRPLGWLDTGRLPADAGAVSGLPLAPYGHTFVPERDSLRAVLDATVLSPTGRAVGVDGAGRVLGLVTYDSVAATIRAFASAGASPVPEQISASVPR